ncbi:MAG: hypothetical protein JW993_16745 [Sedimentisphaerales bacterium]|nr:hypothetical protein [Sedimentisphaerales bacterium]
MKSNPNIDELLCSFIDGELPPRQKTEVQRMAARDPEVAQRLRQLQNCSHLVSVLPRAEAPDDMIEQIRLSLERRTLLGERPISSSGRAGTWHLRLRHLTAVAAMLVLLGVLGLVVYQIVSPVPATTDSSGLTAAGGAVTPPSLDSPPVIVASNTGFSGRLEFQTAAMARAHSFIKRAIDEHGLAEAVASESSDGRRRVYHITCSQEALSGLVADLNEVWRNSESSTLVVETGRFAESVVVKPVTLQQTAKIVGQESTDACVEVAKLEKLAQEMPGQNLLAAVDGSLEAIVPAPALPRPVMTDSRPRTVPPAPEGAIQTSLKIVLIDAGL